MDSGVRTVTLHLTARVLASSRTGRGSRALGAQAQGPWPASGPFQGLHRVKGLTRALGEPPEDAGHSCDGGCTPAQALPTPQCQALGLFPWQIRLGRYM